MSGPVGPELSRGGSGRLAALRSVGGLCLSQNSLAAELASGVACASCLFSRFQQRLALPIIRASSSFHPLAVPRREQEKKR